MKKLLPPLSPEAPLPRSPERWFYAVRREKTDPVQALRRKIRSDHGRHPAVSAALAERLHLQYRQHPSWSYQLHADNLRAAAEQAPALGRCPSYTCLARFMKGQGLFKRPRRGPAHSPGAQLAEERFASREVRSFETEYVHGLWHLDFHHGALRVLLANGQWVYPLLLGILDDRSRLCCHPQWYLREGTEELCHGLSQALQKRALPRALLDDYVPGNIIVVLCPPALCGGSQSVRGRAMRIRPHNQRLTPACDVGFPDGERKSNDRKILQETRDLGSPSGLLAL